MSFTLTVVAQAVAFALFIWFTIKFVWPPMLRAIEARQKAIADGLAAAERGKQDLENAVERNGERLGEARQQAEGALGPGDKRRAQIAAEAKGAAKVEGDRLVTAAKAE